MKFNIEFMSDNYGQWRQLTGNVPIRTSTSTSNKPDKIVGTDHLEENNKVQAAISNKVDVSLDELKKIYN